MLPAPSFYACPQNCICMHAVFVIEQFFSRALAMLEYNGDKKSFIRIHSHTILQRIFIYLWLILWALKSLLSLC
jgi:hypothetical protein